MLSASFDNSPLLGIADIDDDLEKIVKLLDTDYASYRTMARIAVPIRLYPVAYMKQDMA